MIIITVSHRTFQVDIPSFQRINDKLQLLCKFIFYFLVNTTVFQFIDFHFGHPSTIRVHYRTSRPTTCNVVEEVCLCQIHWLFVILTSPLRIIFHTNPFSQFSTNLAVECITIQLVFTMTNQTIVQQEATTDHPIHLFGTTAQAQVVLGRRHVFLIVFLEPVCVGKSIGIVVPLAVAVVWSSTIISRICRISELTVHELLDVFNGFWAEYGTTTIIGLSSIPIVGKVE